MPGTLSALLIQIILRLAQYQLYLSKYCYACHCYQLCLSK